MSLISQEILKTVVTINIEDEEKKLTCIGTGFIVGYPIIKEGKSVEYYTYIITNKHIIEEYKDFIIAINKNTNGIFKLEVNKKKYISEKKLLFHPKEDIDICALRIYFGGNDEIKNKYTFITLENKSLTIKEMKEYPIFESNIVYTIGFPMNLVDEHSKNPIVRMGNIARILHLYNSNKEKKEFLIDAFTFPGNSGSPVLTSTVKNIFPPLTDTKVNFLIGIINNSINYLESLQSIQTKRVRIIEEQNSGLSNVIAVDYIIDLIELFKRQENIDKIKEGKR